jgi:hypothetical protein
MSDQRQMFWPTTGGAVLACILFFGIPARRRSWQKILGIVVLVIACVGGTFACGGSSGGGGNNSIPPTTPGPYTISVTGTLGSVTVTSSPITLTVQ